MFCVVLGVKSTSLLNFFFPVSVLVTFSTLSAVVPENVSLFVYLFQNLSKCVTFQHIFFFNGKNGNGARAFKMLEN